MLQWDYAKMKNVEAIRLSTTIFQVQSRYTIMNSQTKNVNSRPLLIMYTTKYLPCRKNANS